MPIAETNKGRRVELVSCHDRYAKLRPGDQGTSSMPTLPAKVETERFSMQPSGMAVPP